MATTIAKKPNKNRVDLPDDIREKLGLPLGVDIAIFRRKDHVTLVPVRPLIEAIGLLKGAKVDFSTIRDKQDKYQ